MSNINDKMMDNLKRGLPEFHKRLKTLVAPLKQFMSGQVPDEFRYEDSEIIVTIKRKK